MRYATAQIRFTFRIAFIFLKRIEKKDGGKVFSLLSCNLHLGRTLKKKSMSLSPSANGRLNIFFGRFTVTNVAYLPPANEVAKVLFLRLSFILFTGGGHAKQGGKLRGRC